MEITHEVYNSEGMYVYNYRELDGKIQFLETKSFTLHSYTEDVLKEMGLILKPLWFSLENE